ncbi:MULTISPECIES: TIGR02281 family clan AA aspartic protease [unclassified Thioalkalivibrio]|uniref:retropepsin-like aspartic protease family protein n=1 Tax=unclassified Thioalkalivibrio TaxID=2621013 RepID=UPI000362984F|nr:MULTISPECIES: TIGR02281 family clan AA aspartic protease [unclassified Thioalkalivibrio]
MSLAAWLVLGWPAPLAAEELRLHAVFGDRAVLSLGDERAVVATGETGPGGVRVLRTRPGVAWVEIDGEQRELRVEPRRTPARPDAPREGDAEIRVHRDSRGDHALTAGLNGVAVTVVVDPEVDSVLLRATDAERAGIDPDQGRSVRFRDARGTRHGQRVRIGEVQVGGLHRSGVSAIVLSDRDLPRSRLGRSFLEHFVVETDGDALVIR